MKAYKNYNDWIEAYFDRRITEVERQALEDAAEGDSDVARKIKLQREALIALDHMGKQEAQTSIHQVYQRLKKERAQRRSRMARFATGLTVAMTLGAVAIWGPWDLFSQKPQESAPIIKTVATPSAVTLVSDHLKSDPFQQAVNKLAPGSGLSDSAFAAIGTQNYQPAITELQARLERYPRRDDSKLLLAICYLRADEPSLAARQLIPLVEKGSGFEQQASWYLALAYFQEGMPIQAMGLMEQIANSQDHSYYAEAKAFLNKLKGGA